MRSIPTLDNASLWQTISPVQSLPADDGGGGPPAVSDLYFRPAPNDTNNYLQPITGDLYKRPGSP